jgi:hypothetical protein
MTGTWGILGMGRSRVNEARVNRGRAGQELRVTSVRVKRKISTELAGKNRGCYHRRRMAFPIRVCSVCSDEFELKPDKPGFANRCPSCSEPEDPDPKAKRGVDAEARKTTKEGNEARRAAIRDLLYRKDG